MGKNHRGMRWLLVVTTLAVRIKAREHPNDILERLFDGLYRKHDDGFEVNLNPYFKISLRSEGEYRKLAGYHGEEKMRTEHVVLFGASGETSILHYAINPVNGVKTEYKINLKKNVNRDPVQWSLDMEKYVNSTVTQKLIGKADHSQVQNGEWSQINASINSEKFNYTNQFTYKHACFTGAVGCNFHGNVASTLQNDTFSMNFEHSDKAHEIKLFNNQRLLLHVEPLKSAMLKNSLSAPTAVLKIWPNIGRLTPDEIGKLLLHLDVTIASLKRRFSWLDSPCSDDFGIVYVRPETNILERLQAVCSTGFSTIKKASETGQNVAMIGRRFLTETLSHGGQTEFRDWWAKSVRQLDNSEPLKTKKR